MCPCKHERQANYQGYSARTCQASMRAAEQPKCALDIHAFYTISASKLNLPITQHPSRAMVAIVWNLHSAGFCMPTMQHCWSERGNIDLQQAVQVLGELVEVRVAPQPRCQLRLRHQLLSLAQQKRMPQVSTAKDRTAATRQEQRQIGQKRKVMTPS